MHPAPSKSALFRLRTAMALLASGPAAHRLHAQEFTATSLVNLVTAGSPASQAQAINDAGVAVGRRGSAAFVHDGTTATSLSAAVGAGSIALGINASGVIVGDSGGLGFVYDGTKTVLPTFGGSSGSAMGINAAGQVVGWAERADWSYGAYVYSGGVITDLGSLGGYASANAINDAGQIVGYSYIGESSYYQAVRFGAGGPVSLGTLGGNWSSANAINAPGQVAGESTIAGDGETHAFLFSGGTMRDLGTLGGTVSYSYGINDAGLVVGASKIAPGDNTIHAFVSDGTTMFDLNAIAAPLMSVGGSVGFTLLQQANAINNAGQVVGYGTYFNGTSFSQRAFRLNLDGGGLIPIPEPSAWTLLAGFAGLGWACGKRRPQAAGRRNTLA